MTASLRDPEPSQNLASKVVRGSAWVYGRGLVTSVFNIGVMAILARQLTPADFGLVALASVLLRFLAILASNGVGDYVIHDNKEGREERAQAAFWMDLALSSAVTMFGFAAIPLITNFYSDLGLAWILVALLLRYPIDSMAAVPDALIKKSLDFQTLAIRDTVLEIISGLGSILMALTGWGVWSLVIPGLMLAPVRLVIVFWLAGWVPRLPLQIHLWGAVMKYSASIIGANIANTIASEGDTLLIGKTLGSSALGLYNMAWQNANLVGRNVTSTVGKLAMPALSAVSQDAARLREAFNRMARLLAIVSFPLLIGMFVVADLFILTLYGAQWQESILPLRILIIFALRQTVGGPASVIYNVVGRPDLGMKFGLGFIPFYLLSIWLGSFYGIVGVAIGVTATRTIYGMIQFAIGAQLVQESLFDLLKELAQPASAAALMGAGVFIMRLVLEQIQMFQLANLVILVCVGGAFYFLILSTVYRNLLLDLITVVESLSKPLSRQLKRIAFITQ